MVTNIVNCFFNKTVVTWYLITTIKRKVNKMTEDSERRSLREYLVIDRTAAHIEISISSGSVLILMHYR